jgi:hypothetical protein
MFWAIDITGARHTFATIDELFDYVNANFDIIEGFAGVE